MDAVFDVQVFRALTIFFIAVAVPLGAAIAAGLLIGVIQTVTQIQDQTLPSSVKLFVVIGVFAMMGSALLTPLIRFTRDMLSTFPQLVN